MSDNSLARLGALSFGMLLLYRCSDIWNLVRPTTPYVALFALSVWVFLLGGLALMAAAFLTRRPQRLGVPILLSVLVSQWVFHLAFAATEQVNNAPSDTVVLSLEAGILSWLGFNPYGYNMFDVLSAYDSTGQSSTPHLDGNQVEVLPYPALHFLLLRPILPWGLEGARAFYSLSFSLLVLTVFFYAPPRYRNVVLLPLMVNPEMLHFPLYWASDSVWAVLLAWMLWTWDRPYLRAVLLGLACAYKQTPWLFAPFLAVRILREEERPWRSLGLFCSLSIATFAAINLPYAAQDPRAWFQGTFDPMLSPYVPLGRGWSMLMQTNLLPFSKSYFGLLTLSTFLLAIWLYYLNFQRLRPLLWWFPAFVLFFSYRSLQHYFVYSVPLLAMELSRFDPKRLERPLPRLWYLPIAAAAAVLILLTAIFWPGYPTVEARVVARQASTLEVEVSNRDIKPFKPNFYARNDWRTFPWVIVEGPVWLRPGETARYTVGTDLHYRTVSTFADGQLVISDGSGDKGYRAVVDLPLRPSHRYARGFEAPCPESWGRRGDVWFDGETTYFSTSRGSHLASVSRPMPLPWGELSFELLRPKEFPDQASFGLEIRDQRGQAFNLVLGDAPGRGFYQPDHYYQILESKSGWNRYRVNLRNLYTAAGFHLPDLDRMVVHDVEMLERPITLSFVLYSKTPVQQAGVRDVRLESSSTAGHRIAELVYSHHEYQAVLGDIAARRREYDKALELYSRAWPMGSAVRTTQEGSFLVIPGAQEFQGRFAMAGWGWGEPKPYGPTLARPMKDLVGTIPMLAKPGLKLQLHFQPPTSYAVRWDDEAWQKISPGQSFPVPAEAQVRELSVIPDQAAALSGISAVQP